ncbi:hypothetical protein PTI98_008771 [Pleurotus ostreatus]|nr:hypothetical protein PTI98_008771 [Pleurotus ostreatus]
MKNLDQPPAQHPAAAQLSNLKDELNVASRIARRAQADVDIQKASVRVMQKTNAEILLRLTAFEKAARFLPKRPPQPRRPFSATETTIEGSPSQNSDPVPMFESSSPSPISSPHCDFGPPLDGDSEDEGAGPIRISASTQLMSTPLHELENLPLYASPNVGRSAPVVRAQLTHHPPAAQYARPHSTAQGSPVGYITVPESDTLACEEPSSIAVDIPALSSRSPSSFPVGSNPLLPSADPQDKHQSFPSPPPCNEHRSIRNSVRAPPAILQWLHTCIQSYSTVLLAAILPACCYVLVALFTAYMTGKLMQADESYINELRLDVLEDLR